MAISKQMSRLARQVFYEQGKPMMEAQRAVLADPVLDTSRPALFDVDKGAARFERYLQTLLAADKEVETMTFRNSHLQTALTEN